MVYVYSLLDILIIVQWDTQHEVLIVTQILKATHGHMGPKNGKPTNTYDIYIYI